jgi:hypothetical protein
MQMRNLMMLGLVMIGCSCGGNDTSMAMNNPPANPNPNPAPNPSPPPSPGPGPYVMTISGSRLSPATLSVKAGATVMVVSQDSDMHTLSSAAEEGSQTPGAVDGVSFDTQEFQGSASFKVPASAPVGTVIPYFWTLQGSVMGTGTITVAAP